MKNGLNSHEKKLLQTKVLLELGELEGLHSFIEAPMSLLIKECNGCGSSRSKWDIVPDSIIGSYIGHACFLHDWEYFIGTTKRDKKIADKRFKRNLIKTIKTKSTHVVIIAFKYIIACTYYFTVKKFGKNSFWRNKTP